ncbi:MAG: divalent-cation tolerance protein CutA [Longimicrobiaceae bacterium]
MSELAEGGISLVITTVANRLQAEGLAQSVVKERLAACANLVPGVRSVFRWRGAVHEQDEVLILLKTTDEKVAPLLERLSELHPYDLPEGISVRAGTALDLYRDWVRDEVSQ